mmetsp:Transcript_47/g.61  ORF Transcript_47/g.61 Transcript_47/m.61 type:complete len:85 (-) Transcript_47:387-641(-)
MSQVACLVKCVFLCPPYLISGTCYDLAPLTGNTSISMASTMKHYHHHMLQLEYRRRHWPILLVYSRRDWPPNCMWYAPIDTDSW